MASAQCIAALKRANEVRALRAALKRNIAAQDIRTGKLMVLETVSNPPSDLHAVRVEELLRSIRRFGDEKALRYLKLADMSPRRRLGELTDNERARLAKVLA